MPQGIGYGKDNIDALIRLATDPMYDVATPGTIGALQQGIPQPGTAAPTLDYRMNPSYAAGGVVSANGPAPPSGLAPQGAQQGKAISMQQMQADMQRVMQQHPQEIMKLRKVIEAGLQSGELTPQELNMGIQLATAAAQNPALWPQLRRFAIEQGLGTEQEIPQQYDAGMVYTMLLAAKASQMGAGGQQGMPQSQGQPPQTAMRTGGEVPKSNNPDGSVAINAHKGEYVIPEHIVRAKGTDFFDKLIGKDEKTNA